MSRPFPRPVVGWMVPGSSKIYARPLAAYERIAREMMRAKYSSAPQTHPRAGWLFGRTITPRTGHAWRALDMRAVDRFAARLARFLALWDAHRTWPEIYTGLTPEELSAELQRMERESVELAERVAALEGRHG